jgi:hypothetical protein
MPQNIVDKTGSALMALSSSELYPNDNSKNHSFASWVPYDKRRMNEFITSLGMFPSANINNVWIMPVYADRGISASSISASLVSAMTRLGYNAVYIPSTKQKWNILSSEKRISMYVIAANQNNDEIIFVVNVYKEGQGERKLLYRDRFTRPKNPFPPSLDVSLRNITKYLPLYATVDKISLDGSYTITAQTGVSGFLESGKQVIFFRTKDDIVQSGKGFSIKRIKTVTGKGKVKDKNQSTITIQAEPSSFNTIKQGDFVEIQID